MEHDTLARALSAMRNAEVRGKAEITLAPASKTITNVLEILKTEGYIADYSVEGNKKGGVIKVTLAGKINNIGAIKPRYPVNSGEFEKFEQRYLPAKDFGRIIVSTSKGCITHIQAKEKRLGGALLAYVY